MIFYKHYLGDYDSATAHLSWAEDMAYTRLLRLYYRREAPLPADIAQVCRLVRATTKSEREAVASVLREFFTLTQDGWRNERCDEEVEAAQHRAEVNREVGKRGGRPRKTETESKPTENPNGFDDKKPSGFFQETEKNPSQKSEVRSQSKPSVSHTLSDPDKPMREQSPEACAVSREAGAVRAMRDAGMADGSASSPRLIALLDAGITCSELAEAARDAVAKGKGFAYALATAEGRRRDAANVGKLPSARASPGSRESRIASGNATIFKDDSHGTGNAAAEPRDITGEATRVA